MPKIKYVEEELPYKILEELYENSRSSMKKLGRGLNISYHTVGAAIKRLETKYDLNYTMELDETKLGFSEGRLVTIKFGNAPESEYIREKLANDIFVQDAYSTIGDFDILLYVVGLTNKDFQKWQFQLRMKLSKYEPEFKSSTINYLGWGFFPLRNELIQKSPVLSETEKRIIKILNENSRIKFGDLLKKSKTTQMRVVYTLQKLKANGTIKRFSTLTQNPDKRLLMAYTVSLIPNENHMTLWKEWYSEMLKESKYEATNDYSIIADVNGSCDGFYICTFKDERSMSDRGADMTRRVWGPEKPKIEKAMLIGKIVGKWPFHREKYSLETRVY
jgi:DNA-binding Lrp family transcriptional regulator